MSNNGAASEVSCEPFVHTTTKRREWWGWFGAVSWLFFMMYGHDRFILRLNYVEWGWYPFFFMVVFAFAIIVFGFRFKKDPHGLARIAFYTTPVAIGITVGFALLPFPLSSFLYVISPIFMAPALTRRVFGVLQAVGSGKQFTCYISAILVCKICFTAWTIMNPSKEIAFLFPALFAILAWLGIRRPVTISDESPAIGKPRFAKKSVFMTISILVLLFWLNIMSAVISTDIVTIGIAAADIVITVLGHILPTIGFLLYGIMADKGYERAGLICGMMLFIAGILNVLLPSEAQITWLFPLMITNSLGGSYAEFFILTSPIIFLANSRRPILIASLGVVANLISSALLYRIGFWLPEIFWRNDVSVFISAAFSAIGCTVLAFFLFERRQEKTLATTLYGLLYGSERVENIQTTENTATAMEERQNMTAVGLTQEEIEISLLLIEGKTRSEITRKLRLKAAEANSLMSSIRAKISGDNPEPVITAVAKKYKLTGREKDMLQCLRDGMSNSQIASELVISEATVKNHVYSLMKKLPIGSRREIPLWLEAIDIKAE